MTDNYYETLYQTAYGLLKTRADKESLNKHLSCIACPESDSLKDVYQHLLEALVFTRRMKEAIGPVKRISTFVFRFDPIKTQACYEDKWDTLYGRLQTGLNLKTCVQDNKPEACLESFCKGALSGAALLSQLGTIDTFKAFMGSLIKDEMAVAALPILLQKEVYGLGFPMACSFLYHAGYPDYISPAPKVKTLLKDIGAIESMDNYEALKALIMTARVNQEPVEHVHNMFLMISSGRLSENDAKDPGYRREFINHIVPALDKVSSAKSPNLVN